MTALPRSTPEGGASKAAHRQDKRRAPSLLRRVGDGRPCWSEGCDARPTGDGQPYLKETEDRVRITEYRGL